MQDHYAMRYPGTTLEISFHFHFYQLSVKFLPKLLLEEGAQRNRHGIPINSNLSDTLTPCATHACEQIIKNIEC